MNFIRKNWLIILVLIVSLVKGAIWAYIVPPFQAPDEQVHYAEIQYYAEPVDYAPKAYDFHLSKTTLFDINTQNLSPELREYLEKSHFSQTRFDAKEKFNFKDYLPFAHNNKGNLSRGCFAENYPAWLTNYPPLYYQAGALIENTFSGLGVAEKSFFIRLFSVCLTGIFILAGYLMFRELSLSKTSAALLAGAISLDRKSVV